MPRRPAAVEPRHLKRDSGLGTELQCLVEGAPGQRHAGDAGGEAEIILDPGALAGLPSGGGSLDDEGTESFGRSIHGGRKPGRTGPDHDEIVERHLGVPADAGFLGDRRGGRSHEHLAVREDEDGGVLRRETGEG